MERQKESGQSALTYVKIASEKTFAASKAAWPYLVIFAVFSGKYILKPLAIAGYKIAQVSLMPLAIFVSTVLVSTVVGQLVLATIALWISVKIFRIDPLAFLRTEDGLIVIPNWLTPLLPKSFEDYLETHPERALELLEMFFF